MKSNGFKNRWPTNLNMFGSQKYLMKNSLPQMCQTAPFDRRQLTLFWLVGKYQKYFCKIMHARDVWSSPVVRSAEFVGFTGDVFLNVFTEISLVCAKRLENLFELCILSALMAGFKCGAKINRTIFKNCGNLSFFEPRKPNSMKWSYFYHHLPTHK